MEGKNINWNRDFVVAGNSKWSLMLRRLRIKQSMFYQLTHKDQKILDLGCGQGKSLSYFKSKGYNNLYGLEPEKELIAGIPKGIAEIKQGRMEEMPYKNEAFDVVFIHTVLHHLPYENYLKACDEINRVLKPGGSIFMIEPGKYYSLKFIEFASWVLGWALKTFKALNRALYAERNEQRYFIRNHSFFRDEFLRKKYMVIRDKYFFVMWIFVITKGKYED